MTRVGTLGGSGTFAGQATQVVVDRYRDFDDIVYYDTMDDVWEAIASGEVGVGVLTAETTRTGFTETFHRLLDRTRPIFVLGEVIVPYRCMLLGKPGSRLEDIQLVLGHGSLRQCEAWLAANLPSAQVRVHALNSLAAAREVLAADGTVAVVGTQLSGEASGLEVMAADIDEGSVGTWWLMSRELAIGDQVDRVVVGVEASDPDVLRAVLVRMEAFGFRLRSMATVGRGDLFRYAHLLVLSAAQPRAASVTQILDDLPQCWVLGAFSSVEEHLPDRRTGMVPSYT